MYPVQDAFPQATRALCLREYLPMWLQGSFCCVRLITVGGLIGVAVPLSSWLPNCIVEAAVLLQGGAGSRRQLAVEAYGLENSTGTLVSEVGQRVLDLY